MDIVWQSGLEFFSPDLDDPIAKAGNTLPRSLHLKNASLRVALKLPGQHRRQWLLLNCADCEFRHLRMSSFDTSIAQICSFAWTLFKVLLSLAVPNLNAF